MSVNQLLCNFPPNSNFTVPTSNQGPVTFSVGGPPGGAGPAPTVTQQVFVAPWGSNTAGTGGEETPFLTIAHAQASILDSGPTKTYQIILYPGDYTENVAFEAFVNIVGWNASNCSTNFYPSHIVGSFTLGPSFGGAQIGQTCLLTSLDLDGTLTLNYTGVGSTTGTVSFTNCQSDNTIVITGSPQTEFHNCVLFGAFTQTGGNVFWYNTVGVNPSALLTVQALVADSASFNANGGSWQGNVTCSQNGANPGTTVSFQSDGCNFASGTASLVASATDTPSVRANFGDLPENVALTGAAAALSANMRISHRFTGITGAVAGVVATVIPVGGGTVNPPFGALTTIDLVVPTALIGVTSIEGMQCSCTPVGSNWGHAFGPHAAIYNFRYEQVGGAATIHFDVLNTGLAFNITDALTLNFSAHLPVVL